MKENIALKKPKQHTKDCCDLYAVLTNSIKSG